MQNINSGHDHTYTHNNILAKVGLFASALIKKRRYWQKYISDKKIKAHFADKEVGYVGVWPGTFQWSQVHAFPMKEADYIMNVILTYGVTNSVPRTEIKKNF